MLALLEASVVAAFSHQCITGVKRLIQISSPRSQAIANRPSFRPLLLFPTVDLKTLPGISKPFDQPYFDPLSLSKEAKIRDVRRWRESEIVHGRVAMLASVG